MKAILAVLILAALFSGAFGLKQHYDAAVDQARISDMPASQR